MLLRRITEHVMTQNWFAVGIDFVIVVIGVFIGIQVANWNEARAEEERIAAQLTSFRDELILARDDLADRQTYYEERIASVSELRERLESGTDLPAQEFNRLTVSAVRGSGLNVTFRGYEEITTTGAISKVADERLRDLLYTWDTSLTGIKNSDEVLEETRNGIVIPIVLEATALGNALQADDRYKDMTVTNRFEIDLEDIRANRKFDSALALRHVQAKQQLNSLLNFIVVTEVLIAALEDEETN
jgi:hypothetical protein